METNKIYRKLTCPWGKKAISLMDKKNISYEDHIFESKEDELQFKDKHNVKTTPQVFLEGSRIGGFTDLAKNLGEEISEEKTTTSEKSYRPIIAVFAVSALLSLATAPSLMNLMGYFLVILACLKLMDINSFQASFSNYDLLAKKIPFYGYLYPFLELGAGLGFLSGKATIIVASFSIIVGLVGGYSIFKAVYIDKLDLNCACVGGNTKVPLGIVSFSENAIMAIMGTLLLI